MARGSSYQGWGTCLDCGYEGMLVYSPMPGETYTDHQALGVMMTLRCPACASDDNVLVSLDYYRELLSGGHRDGG